MFDIVVKGTKEVLKAIENDKKQLRFASAVALTKTAVKAKEALQKDVVDTFKTPKPFTVKSFRVSKATKSRLIASVSVKPIAAQYLFHHVEKQDRLTKEFERVLRSKGLLPANMYVVPGRGVKLNAYGNVGKALLKTISSQAGTAGSKYFVATTRAGTTAIWMRHGRGGRSIKPMLMFVKKPEYDQTFNFYKTAT
ncbi:MAG: hypothetical protein GY799_29500, partial [Desulfobulbaceae bacterium]|nr:hypothetical protein [Desulfobulbaceae bacterium]